MARRALKGDGRLRVMLTIDSQNRKTGRMPVAIVSPNTCPEVCPWRAGGCYAERDFSARWWGKLARGQIGMSWSEFCREVRKLPEGQLWRYAEAGDLPGNGDHLDVMRLEKLVRANRGRRGFAYTHKPLDRDEGKAVREAILNGFIINLSADNLEHADRRVDMNIAPVVVVLPSDAPNPTRTPMGRKVCVCPAQVRKGLTCLDCQLCAKPRRAIIGFRAHGQCKHIVESRIKQMRLGI